MNKVIKLILGVAPLYPIVFLLLFFARPLTSGVLFSMIFMFVTIFTMLWIFALVIIFITNISKNDRIDKKRKTLWAVAIYLGHMIAMSVYWYFHIWWEPEVGTRSA